MNRDDGNFVKTNTLTPLLWNTNDLKSTITERLDAITDALIYQSQFGGIYCKSFISANCTVTTTITF